MVKQYTSQNVEDVLASRRLGFSIREISKKTKIPKSVIGRWIKEPDKSIQKSQIREIRGKLTPKAKKHIDKFLKKVVNKPKGKQASLRVKAQKIDGIETGGYEVIS